MRRIQLADFYGKTKSKEILRILNNDDLVLGLEEAGQLRLVLLSAKRHGELISAQAGLDAICSRIADGNSPECKTATIPDRLLAEVIEIVSRQKYTSITTIQVMFDANNFKARHITERLERLGIIKKLADSNEYKVLVRATIK
jgi:hypothetical protein